MKFSFNKSFFYKICIIFFVFHSITISTIRDSETPPLSFKKIAQNLTAIQKIALEHRYDCQYLDILCHKITQGMMPSDEIIDKGFNEACECLDSYKHTISRAQLEQLATNLEADYQLLLTNENTPPATRADLVRFHNIRVHQNANMGNAYVSNNITINNDLFVHNNETIGGDLTVGGDTVILGNTTIDGNTTINGNIILSGTVLSPSQGVFTNGLSVTGPTNINTTTAAPTTIGTGGGTTTIGSTSSTNTIQGTTDFTGSTVMNSPTGVVLTVSGNAANPAVFIQGNNTTLAPALKLCGNPPAYAGNYILQIDPTTCVVTQGTISTGTAGGINSLFGNTGAASGYQVSVVGGSNITTSGDDLSTLTIFLNPSISIPGSISAGTTLTATGLTVSSFSNGVVVSNSTGILSSSAGTAGQVLTSNGPGATPTFKPAAATGISTLTTDAGSATGSSVTIHGGSNISTIATGTYVTVNLINNPTLSGLLTANAGATVTGLTNINTGVSGSITTIGNTATPSTTNIFGSTNINTTATNQVTTIGATTNTTNLAGNITVNNALLAKARRLLAV